MFTSLYVYMSNIPFQRWFVGSSMRSSSQVLLFGNNWKHTEMALHMYNVTNINTSLFHMGYKIADNLFHFSIFSKLANFLPHFQVFLNLRLITHESKSILKIFNESFLQGSSRLLYEILLGQTTSLKIA